MHRTSRVALTAALLLSALAAPTGATATSQAAASTPAAATLRAELDLSGEQTIQEAKDRAVGPGPELTAADTTKKAPSYGGNVVADIDPTDGTVTITTSSQGTHYWQQITVHLQDPDLTSLDTESDSFGGDAKVTVTGESGDWTLTWTSSRDAQLYINPDRSSVFLYPRAPAPTQPQPASAPSRPLAVSTPGFQLRGHWMILDVTGFAPDETYLVEISGIVVGHGSADAQGEIHRKVRVPRRAHHPAASLVVRGATHQVHKRIRVRIHLGVGIGVGKP